MPFIPTHHSDFQREIYGRLGSKPPRPTDPRTIEALAKKKMSRHAWNYIDGSAAMGTTYRNNLAAFNHYRLIPRMLKDVTERSTSITLFGKVFDSPILAAPIGVQGIVPGDAECDTARGCTRAQVPMILSTAATRTIEQVAEQSDFERWFQLYWPKSDDITISLLQRAQKSGYSVLVVTLDTFVLGWRSRDLDDAYLPFVFGQGTQIGFSDPVFNAKFDKSPPPTREDMYTLWSRLHSPLQAIKVLANVRIIKKSQAWLDEMNSGTYMTWSKLSLLRNNWTGPIVLKGIQSVEDAKLAVEHGMDGIVVSNHGGRQVSGAIASLDALKMICAHEEVKSKLTILFDSGIRTGSDIIKAMALGADAVLVGRPYIYGLATGGEDGVVDVFRGLKADLEVTMGSMGLKTLSKEDLAGCVVESSRSML